MEENSFLVSSGTVTYVPIIKREVWLLLSVHQYAEQVHPYNTSFH